ncbi:MAG: CRISPR-associated protein Csx20 [Desulfamplus sp.]
MPKTLFLIFNHEITQEQGLDAENSLEVSKFVDLPAQLKEFWKQIPAELESVKEYLSPVSEWLSQNATNGDYILIQGDFGAVYYLVNLAFELGLVPVYSTTARRAEEVRGRDGEIRLTHTFRHVRFRKYERCYSNKSGKLS